MNKAHAIEDVLRDTAKKLGLTVEVTKVMNDPSGPSPYSYCIDAALVRERATTTIDEEILDRKAFADLVIRELEGLQLRLHDQTAEAMQKRDIRERVFRLSDEDKETLNEMYRDACDRVLSDFSYAGIDKASKYHALMARLFR